MNQADNIKEIKINEIRVNKVLIFDSSSIITLNMIGMFDLLKELKVGFDGKFLITKAVYNEIVNVPLEIKKYELRALMIKKAIESKILEVVNDPEIDKKTAEILEKSNSVLFTNHDRIRIIHRGEASFIALYDLLSIDNKNKALVIDERTTRMLLENPWNIGKLMESKMHKKISIDKNLAEFFVNKRENIIRSSELLFIGLEKKKIGLENGWQKLSEALLYGAKSYGCSISDFEIEEVKRGNII